MVFTFLPWPQRPPGLVDLGFEELAKRWRPILDVYEDAGVDLCYEIHPGEDLHDGITFERFLAAVDDHPRANILYDPSHFILQQLDYLAFIDIYRERRIVSFWVCRNSRASRDPAPPTARRLPRCDAGIVRPIKC